MEKRISLFQTTLLAFLDIIGYEVEKREEYVSTMLSSILADAFLNVADNLSKEKQATLIEELKQQSNFSERLQVINTYISPKAMEKAMVLQMKRSLGDLVTPLLSHLPALQREQVQKLQEQFLSHIEK